MVRGPFVVRRSMTYMLIVIGECWRKLRVGAICDNWSHSQKVYCEIGSLAWK